MFGMESGKKQAGPVDTFEFDMEAELKDPGKLRAMKEQIEERIQQLKTMLRQGGEQEEFDRAQTLLHGYLAMQKVLGRIGKSM